MAEQLYRLGTHWHEHEPLRMRDTGHLQRTQCCQPSAGASPSILPVPCIVVTNTLRACVKSSASTEGTRFLKALAGRQDNCNTHGSRSTAISDNGYLVAGEGSSESLNQPSSTISQ